MGCLIEHKAQVIFVSASSVNENGKKRRIVIESRPEFAIVRLLGARGQFSIVWEVIYEAAMRRHEENLRLEAEAEKPRRVRNKKLTD
ncbi:MAG: hypothetical protein ABSC48_12290 [Terracidiphilus sp.]|jgi:hypothetical protein